jgi:hypothetical protein
MQLYSSSMITLPDGSRGMTFTIVLPSEIHSALEFEGEARSVLNKCGVEMMDYALKSFDTEGEDLQVGGRTYTTKGAFTETYQFSFGSSSISRQVYQNSAGGRTFCPMAERARMIGLATPHLASLVASTYADNNGREVQRIFAEHHQRELSLGFIQQLATDVAELALRKEKRWSYELKTPVKQVGAIVLGIDGTCAPLCEGGWKQVMVGTITLCDKAGDKLETIYIANAPEDGKATFYERMRREIAAVKKTYPKVKWIGLSDGARDLRPFLEEHTEVLVLDFYHVSEYINKAAAAAYPNDPKKAGTWIADALHTLKHEENGAAAVIAEFENWTNVADGIKLTRAGRADVERSIAYMQANTDRMGYSEAIKQGYPIGSGITEAACKTVVKARLCGSGMRWNEEGMQHVLCLRALRQSTNRWAQFFAKIDRHGL